MPCMGPYSDRELLDRAGRENDKLTRMMCNMCRNLEAGDDYNYIPRVRGLITWWKEHKRLDAKRETEERETEKMEKLRKKAISKLSKKERESLGLDRRPRGTMR